MEPRRSSLPQRAGDVEEALTRSAAATLSWEERSPYQATETDKVCTRCGERKPLTEFYKKAGREGTRRPYYAQCRACHRCSTKAWKEANAERKRAGDRRANLARLGLTPDTFDALVAKQGGGCAICSDADPTHVDHDHSCCPPTRGCASCVRGILCARCNIGLGYFRDDPEALLAAVEYLRRTKPC